MRKGVVNIQIIKHILWRYILKRIIIIRDNPVSPDTRVEKIADSLLIAGYSVTLLAWDRDENYRIKCSQLLLPRNKVDIIRFGIKASFGDGIKNLFPFCVFQIKMFIWLIKNRNAYDVIHACDLYTALTSFICAKILRKRIVFDIFDFLGDINEAGLSRLLAKIQYKLINNVNATIICSEQRKEQIRGSSPKKLEIIHNSPQNADIQEMYNLNKDKIKIVYVGILQEKRYLREMADILRTLNNVELHIGGFGKLEPYFKQLASRNTNVFFYGKMQYHETLSLEKSCDIMTAVYDPSVRNHYFAAPNKFYEALLLGKPLVMIKNTGMSSIVADNKIGELSDYNVESLKEAFRRIIQRKNEWESISERMKKIYEKDFSWDKMEKRLVDLYRAI